MKRQLWALLPLILAFAACVQPVTPTALPVPSQPTPTAASVQSDPPVEQASPVGDAVTLTQLKILDGSGRGWGVGKTASNPFDRILRTLDGGATWKDVTPNEPVANPDAVTTSAQAAFIDDAHAWVLYYNPMPAALSDDILVYRTSDGGQSWQVSEPLQRPENAEFFLPTDLGFFDAQNGWLMAHLGAGMNHDYVAIYKSANGGKGWQRVVDPSLEGQIQNSLPMSCRKTGVIFSDPLTGWVSGGCGGVVPGLFLYKTTNGGVNWLQLQLPSPSSNPSLLTAETNFCTTQPPSFPSPEMAYMQVQCTLSTGQNQAWLYTSPDGGASWTPQPLPDAYAVTEFVPGGVGWWLGGPSQDPNQPRSLYQTKDFGKSWQLLLENMNWSGQPDFVDPQNGWAVALGAGAYHLLKTNNGGQLWVELKPVIVK